MIFIVVVIVIVVVAAFGFVMMITMRMIISMEMNIMLKIFRFFLSLIFATQCRFNILVSATLSLSNVAYFTTVN